jgi:tetratricopeptide (TPR) repeat protein
LHINLGAAHEKLDENEAAIQEFNKALQFSPSDADAMWGLATSLKKTGRYDEAITEYQRVMQYSKKRDDVRDSMVEIGGCYQSMGRLRDAVTWLERYCQATPRPSDVDQVQKIIAELREAGTKESFSNPTGSDYADSMGQKEKQVWEKSNLPLRVYIASGTGVKGFRKPFTGMMTDALTAWCQASNQKITWFQVEDESQANVVIRWSPDMKGAPGQGGEGGLCEKFGDSDGQTMIIGKAVLTMRTLGLDGKEVPDIEMRAVCLHETGHALGLGHSANNKDVMFFSETSEHKLALTARDKATIARLYADYPVLSLNGQ